MKAKLIFFLLLGSCLMAHSQSYDLLSRKVNVSFQNTSIEDILKSIELEDLSFVYSPEVFDVKKRVSIRKTDTSIKVILDELFSGQQMEAFEMNGQILLRKKKGGNKESKAEKTTKPDTTEVKKRSIPESVEAKERQKSDSISEGTNGKTDTGGLNQGSIEFEAGDSEKSRSEQSLVVQTTSVIPIAQIKPYEFLYDFEEPSNLDFSSLLPQYISVQQGSIWEEFAQRNKDKPKPEKENKERSLVEKKFRIGIGSYTGYTEINNTPSLLLGGRLIYYPKTSYGIGFSGNAFMSKNFFNEELNGNIRLEGGYGGLAFEYVLFPQSLIHINIPLAVGAGGYSYVEENQLNPSVLRETEAFFMLEGGLELEVNVASFMKVGFGASYRDVSGSGLLNQNSQTEVIDASVLEGMSYGIVVKFGMF